MSKYHKTKDGEWILISELETSHLRNIINLIHRKVQNRLNNPKLEVYSDAWGEPAYCDYEGYDEYELLEKYNFYSYVKELMTRL